MPDKPSHDELRQRLRAKIRGGQMQRSGKHAQEQMLKQSQSEHQVEEEIDLDQITEKLKHMSEDPKKLQQFIQQNLKSLSKPQKKQLQKLQKEFSKTINTSNLSPIQAISETDADQLLLVDDDDTDSISSNLSN